MSATAPAWGQHLDPNAPDFLGIEHDHAWWLNDAARLVREEAWAELDPQHLRHALEEIADLQRLLSRATALAEEPVPF
jgi:hypothetical protein